MADVDIKYVTIPRGWVDSAKSTLRLHVCFYLSPSDSGSVSQNVINLLSKWPNSVGQLFSNWTLTIKGPDFGHSPLRPLTAVLAKDVTLGGYKKPLHRSIQAWEAVIQPSNALEVANRRKSQAERISLPLFHITKHSALDLHNGLRRLYTDGNRQYLRANAIASTRSVADPLVGGIASLKFVSQAMSALEWDYEDAYRTSAHKLNGGPIDYSSIDGVREILPVPLTAVDDESIPITHGDIIERNRLRLGLGREDDVAPRRKWLARACERMTRNGTASSYQKLKQIDFERFPVGYSALDPDQHVAYSIFQNRLPRTSATAEDYRRGISAQSKGRDSYAVAPERPPLNASDFDIFQRIAAIRRYPILLPVLGLTIELHVDVSSLSGIIDSAAERRCSVTLDPATVPNNFSIRKAVPTAAIISRSKFVSDSNPCLPTLTSGFLSRNSFRITTCELEGTANKLRIEARKNYRRAGWQAIVPMYSNGLKITQVEDPITSLAGSDGGPILALFDPKQIRYTPGAPQPWVNSSAATFLVSAANRYDKGSFSRFYRGRRYFSLADTAKKFFQICSDTTIKWNVYKFEFLPRPNAKPSTFLAEAVRNAGGDLVGLKWQFAADMGYQIPPEPLLPQMQTGGIQVIRTGLFDEIERSVQLRGSDETGAQIADVYAEDLILGYVPEVGVEIPGNAKQTMWIPLTLREEIYDKIDPLLSGKRGGVFSLVTSHTTDGKIVTSDALSSDLHASEIVLRWKRWALGSKMPTKDDNSAGYVLQDNQAKSSQRRAKLKVPSYVGWSVPVFLRAARKTVPIVRFISFKPHEETVGRYKLRIKVYDSAGNLPDSSVPGTIRHVELRRFEIVRPPEILRLPQAPPSESAIIGTQSMVVRGGNIENSYLTDVRWLVPPRISDELASMHGMLPLNRAKREALGTFNDVRLESTGAFPTRTAGGAVGEQAEYLGATKRDAYPVILPPADDPSVPYYPDPLSRGVAWRLEYLKPSSGATSPRVQEVINWADNGDNLASFYGERGADAEWPSARAVKVELIGISGGQISADCNWLYTSHDSSAGFPNHGCYVISVRLPEGYSAKLHISSVLSDIKLVADSKPLDSRSTPYLNTLALATHPSYNDFGDDDWCIIGNDQKERIDAAHGLNPFLSPATTILLRHAAPTPGKGMDPATKKDVLPKIWSISSSDGALWPVSEADANTDPGVPDFQRPVADPSVAGAQVQAQITIGASCHSPSTGKLRFSANYLGCEINTATSDLKTSNIIQWKMIKGDLGDTNVDEDLAGGECRLIPVMLTEPFSGGAFRLMEYYINATTRDPQHFSDVSKTEPADLMVTGPSTLIAMLNCCVPGMCRYSLLSPTFQWTSGSNDRVGDPAVTGDPQLPSAFRDRPTYTNARQTGYRIYLSISDLSSGAYPLIGIVTTPRLEGLLDAAPDPGLVNEVRDYSTAWGTDPTMFEDGIIAGPQPEDLDGFCVFVPSELANLRGFVDELLNTAEGDQSERANVSRAILSSFPKRLQQEMAEKWTYAKQERIRTQIGVRINELLLGGHKGIFAKQLETKNSNARGIIEIASWCRQYLGRIYNDTDYFLRVHLFDKTDQGFRRFHLALRGSAARSCHRFTVVPYLPRYDEKTKKWFIDIKCRPPAEYSFVQFALVTLQAHSVDGCHISPVQKMDIIQILPNRWLSVCRGANKRTLEVAVTNIDPIARTKGPTFSQLTTFKATLLRSDAVKGAVIDNDVEGKDGGSKLMTKVPLGNGVSYTAQFVWKSKLPGKRRLLVEELRVSHDRESSLLGEQPGKMYFDILGI